jgi:type 1 glutamine amidotransferase
MTGLGGLIGCAAMVAACMAAAGEQAAPVRVLILSGKNNHDWKSTTPVIEKALTESGRFTVEITNNPEQCTEETFKRCDVILSNWTNWPDVNKRVWDEKTEKAFLEFVRGGKGFVSVHAGSCIFYTWPEFLDISGSWWKLGQTGHGPMHAFKVTIGDREHPITKGLEDFETTDELWHKEGAVGQPKVLCSALSDKAKGGSGQSEPVLTCRECGKGRGVRLTLGHDAKAMQNPGFKTLLVRATEWAATGEVTPGQAKK